MTLRKPSLELIIVPQEVTSQGLTLGYKRSILKINGKSFAAEEITAGNSEQMLLFEGEIS